MLRFQTAARGLFVLFFAAAVLATQLRPAGAQDVPYEINAILSLSGPAAFLGAKEAEAFRAIETAVNKTGGIRGRSIKFLIADDQTNPQVALQLANGLIAKSVQLIVGPTISGPCNALMPIVANAGPLVYCLSPAVHPPAGSYMFTATAATPDVVSAMMHFARQRGWKRLGLITASDATGQDLSKQIDTLLALPENRELKIAVHETFNISDISVNAQMAQIKAAKPQVLITTSTGTPFATLLHGIQDVGIDLPIVSNGSNMTFTAMTQYAALLPRELYFTGDRGMTVEDRAQSTVRSAQGYFADALRAIGTRPDFGHVLAWDAGMLVVDLLRQSGTDATAAQLHDRLVQLQRWSGISGVYDFRKEPQRGVGLDATMIYRWDAAKSDFAATSGPGGYAR
jgi:branched-chain amino acid transport system substrate-binding protein